MAYTKLSTKIASSMFSKAQNYSRMAMHDQNDPASTNLLSAIDAYFNAIGSSQSEIIYGINDLLDRVDKIQQQLNK